MQQTHAVSGGLAYCGSEIISLAAFTMWYSVQTTCPTSPGATEKLNEQNKLQQYQNTFSEASVWVLKAAHRKWKHTNRTECGARCVWHNNCTRKGRGEKRREKYGHHHMQHLCGSQTQSPQPEVVWRILVAARVYNRKSVQLPYGFYTCHLDRMM